MKRDQGDRNVYPSITERVVLIAIFVLFASWSISSIRSVGYREIYGGPPPGGNHTVDQPDKSFVGQVKDVVFLKDSCRISFVIESDDKKREEFSFFGVPCDLYFRTGDTVKVSWKSPLFFNPLTLQVKVIKHALPVDGITLNDVPWIEFK